MYVDVKYLRIGLRMRIMIEILHGYIENAF